MSSEAEALRDADRAASEFYREWWKPKASDKRLTELRTRYNAALSEWQQQIERRVLAQQPCYGAWSNGEIDQPGIFYTCEEMDESDAEWPRGSRCPTCTARQTQETSG